MRLYRHLRLGLALLSSAALGACGDDGPTAGGDTSPDTKAEVQDDLGGDPDVEDDADTTSADTVDDADTGPTEPVDPAAVFAFGLDPAQPVSAAPFPNDLYLDAQGRVALQPFQDDPVIGAQAKPEILALLSAAADGREGFGFTAGVNLFLHPDAELDLASFDGKVGLIGVAGHAKGQTVDVRVELDPSGAALVVTPRVGHFMMPDSTYVAFIQPGPKLADGRAIAPQAGLAAVLADDGDAPAPARAAFAPAREWLAEPTNPLTPDHLLVATVFTTEPTMPLAKAVVAAARAQISTPTRAVAWNAETDEPIEAPVIDGPALDAYFGQPLAPFADNPGVWSAGSRVEASQLPGQDGPYAGGTYHANIGRVVNGSLTVPTFNMQRTGDTAAIAPLALGDDGLPVASVSSMVPFTLFLCEEHLDDPADLPVVVFSHGGGATRADALPIANLGCELGLATIAIDMVFHGGRLSTEFVPDLNLVVPTGTDISNQYTGLSAGDEGYAPDYIGDGGSAAAAVAPLFAVPQSVDPRVIEANLLSITADTANLVETLQTGDWSQVMDGLSFDPTRMFHASLSFGTSFHTALFATVDDFQAILASVGSGRILTENLLKAPANAVQASGVLFATMGLKTPPQRLQTEGHLNLPLQLLQWLSERGDPLGYAPYVLRLRGQDRPRPDFLSSSDSWDETLYTPAQITYNRALGLKGYDLPVLWELADDVPGSFNLDLTDHVEPETANTEFQGQVFTSGLFYYSDNCHAQLITPVCTQRFEQPHPPAVALEAPISSASPVCALHNQAHAFLGSVLAGGPAELVAPLGDCSVLYGSAE